MLASVVGGLVYQSHGGKIMYKGAMFISVGWSCVVFLYLMIGHMGCTNKNSKLENDNVNAAGDQLLEPVV